MLGYAIFLMIFQGSRKVTHEKLPMTGTLKVLKGKEAEASYPKASRAVGR